MLEAVLSEISSSGFLVNNLFQLYDGRWRASLRKEDTFAYDFGEGISPTDALLRALSASLNSSGTPIVRNTFTAISGPGRPTLSLASLGL